MALQKTFTNAKGLTATDAYIRILQFHGNSRTVSFKIGVYANQNVRNDNEFNFLDSLHFTVPYFEGLSMTFLYDWLKTQPGFEGAIDV